MRELVGEFAHCKLLFSLHPTVAWAHMSLSICCSFEPKVKMFVHFCSRYYIFFTWYPSNLNIRKILVTCTSQLLQPKPKTLTACVSDRGASQAQAPLGHFDVTSQLTHSVCLLYRKEIRLSKKCRRSSLYRSAPLCLPISPHKALPKASSLLFYERGRGQGCMVGGRA